MLPGLSGLDHSPRAPHNKRATPHRTPASFWVRVLPPSPGTQVRASPANTGVPSFPPRRGARSFWISPECGLDASAGWLIEFSPLSCAACGFSNFGFHFLRRIVPHEHPIDSARNARVRSRPNSGPHEKECPCSGSLPFSGADRGKGRVEPPCRALLPAEADSVADPDGDCARRW